MALTGFGQMPIFKRYYVSDIPGFGWLADFWTTRYIHYVGAILLLAWLAYVVVDFLGARRPDRKLTPSGKLRLALLGAIVLTGVLFVIKNFSIYLFSPDFIVLLTLCHLGCVMFFLMTNLYCLVFKKQWTTPR
jgi:heme A synthase